MILTTDIHWEPILQATSLFKDPWFSRPPGFCCFFFRYVLWKGEESDCLIEDFKEHHSESTLDLNGGSSRMPVMKMRLALKDLCCRVLKGPGVFKGGGGNWGTLRIPFGKIGEP